MIRGFLIGAAVLIPSSAAFIGGLAYWLLLVQPYLD